MTAYYNENDPFAAQWLRNLIDAGHIAPGVVDERSIRDVEAFELRKFTQCHFFAGIGIWSGALRAAGWPDDEPIWTGSCPCQPFSAAGKQKGFDDDRHLWPAWFDLIRECRPPILVGEQVASALDWLDLVSADLEGARYAFGASDLCAAGFGGAHIRQRIYFVAHADDAGPQGNNTGGRLAQRDEGHVAQRDCPPVGLAESDRGQREWVANGEGRECDWQATGRQQGNSEFAAGGELRWLADSDGRNSGEEWQQRSGEHGQQSQDGVAGGLADDHEQARGGRGIRGPGESAGESAGATRERPSGLRENCPPHAPLLGRTPVDWLYCRDGKWRPVEPGTFPLVDADTARVGKLRAYGNALDFETATQFCAAVREIAGV